MLHNFRAAAMATNITIKIDDELARAAKVYAAQHGTSLSRLVAEQLEREISRGRAYASAKTRALQSLQSARPLGWQKPLSRDEIHDR